MSTFSPGTVKYIAIMCGTIAFLLACMLYPYLPGRYDPAAAAISAIAQSVGVVGVPLVPLGLGWLFYELRSQHKPRQRQFVLASVVATSLAALCACVVAAATGGYAMGVFVAAGCVFALAPLIASCMNRIPPTTRLHPAPMCLVLLPVSALIFQLLFAPHVTAWTRHRVIAQCAELIGDIEKYRVTHGTYPEFLDALWPDYTTGAVGIERYSYVRHGGAYSLYFELPTFFLDDLGTREFVVYNPIGQHLMVSHTRWILFFSPEALRANQGWYAVHEAGQANWKSFLFD